MSQRNSTPCSACGTSLVNHRLLLSLNILEETFGRLGSGFFSLTSSGKLQRITIYLEKLLFSLSALLHIARFSDDPEKALTGRSKLIWLEAQRRGILMQQAVFFGKYIEFYRARLEKINGQKGWFYFQSLPVPSELPQGGYEWLDNKFKLFEKLSAHDVPVPKTKKIYTWRQAEKAFHELRKPIIVKPNFGSRGRHTTTNIHTLAELKKALKIARQITISIVMQEHLSGSVCRATVIENKLVGFFKADAPQVTGDGIQTIRQLVEQKNQNRPEKLSDISITDDLIEFISRLGFALESIPQLGQTLNLSAKTGRMYGGYTREMLPEVHPEMHFIFQKAGKLGSAPVLGFDLIIQDPTKDPRTEKWGIIECNSMPYIDLHYFALEGKPINLAENVWDLWKK